MGRRVAWLGLALAFCASDARADETEPETLVAKLTTVGGAAHVSFDLSAAFTEEFRKRVAGGLEGLAVVDLTFSDPFGRMVSSRSRVCRFHLDIWEDILEARISDGGRRRRYGFLLIDDGFRACGLFDKLEIARMERLSFARGYVLRVTLRLNPLSEDLMRESREFMSNPRGTALDRPRSFFGAIARLFSSEEELDTGETFVFEASGLQRPETASP
ncbi:MAG: hypothetical protein HY791_17630 [Deltaproteobacteria bacterium]|nr:hypothetical protein [Deltaproteobacteria bacterium]